MNRPTVAVIGASTNRAKYGNKAVRAFRESGFDVLPVNPRAEQIEGLPCYPSLDALPPGHIDRVSFYVPPEIGLSVLDQVARRGNVGEVWLNPGSESPEQLGKAAALGLSIPPSLLARGTR